MKRVVSRVNQRGTLTLPREARERLGIMHGGHLLLETDESGSITLRALRLIPLEDYTPVRVAESKRMNESPLAGNKLRWRKTSP